MLYALGLGDSLGLGGGGLHLRALELHRIALVGRHLGSEHGLGLADRLGLPQPRLLALG